MSKQTRRACNVTEDAYQRVTRCAQLHGCSRSSVLEAVIASKMDGLPLEQLLTHTPDPHSPSASPSDPDRGPDDGGLGGGVCMF